MTELDELIERYKVAVRAGGSLQAVVSEIDQCVFDDARFPDVLFDHLLSSLRSPELLNHRDALVLIKLFEDQATLLNADQAVRLVDSLPDFVDAVNNDIAAFLATEIWMTLSASGQTALETLVAFQVHCRPQRLAVMVHGFDWLCKTTSDASVRKACLMHLARYQQHVDPAVAAEAGAAIARRSSSNNEVP